MKTRHFEHLAVSWPCARLLRRSASKNFAEPSQTTRERAKALQTSQKVEKCTKTGVPRRCSAQASHEHAKIAAKAVPAAALSVSFALRMGSCRCATASQTRHEPFNAIFLRKEALGAAPRGSTAVVHRCHGTDRGSTKKKEVPSRWWNLVSVQSDSSCVRGRLVVPRCVIGRCQHHTCLDTIVGHSREFNAPKKIRFG